MPHTPAPPFAGRFSHHRTRGMSKVQLLGMVLFLTGLLVIAISGGAMLMGSGKAADLPELGPAPEWSLTDRNGQTVTNQDMAGKPYVTLFYFLQCKGICPNMLGKMQQLDATIEQGDLNGKAHIVAMSIDGANDTPEAITAFYDVMQLTDGVTHMLTGEQALVWSIAESGFKVPTGANQPDATGTIAPGMEFMHSGRFILVDGQGQIRGYYDHEHPEELQQLVQDLKSLTK